MGRIHNNVPFKVACHNIGYNYTTNLTLEIGDIYGNIVDVTILKGGLGNC